MLYDYNPEPDSGSPADQWHSLDSQIVEEAALIIDQTIAKYGGVGMMRRKQEVFGLILTAHPELKGSENHYFWEGLRLQKNRFDWPEGHPMTQKKGDA